jgi:hypothetical protein
LLVVANRYIDQKMWGDAKFLALSKPAPNAQTLWIYLLIGPYTTSLPGLIRIGEAALAESLGWPIKALRDCVDELLRLGMIRVDWKSRLIWLPNAPGYNRPANPNVVKGWKSHWDLIPECELKTQAFEAIRGAIPFPEVFEDCCRNGSRNALPSHFDNGIGNQGQGQGQDQRQGQDQEGNRLPDSIDEFVSRWNSIPGISPCRAFNSERRAAFRARCKEPSWLQNLDAAFDALASSSFCRGENDRGWKATVDWFLKPGSVVKLVEGFYGERTKVGATNGIYDGIAEWVEDAR